MRAPACKPSMKLGRSEHEAGLLAITTRCSFGLTLMRHVMKLCRFIRTVIRGSYKLAYTGTDKNLYRGSRKFGGLSCLTAVAYYNFILGEAHSKFLSEHLLY
jgi:hypothetical protein